MIDVDEKIRLIHTELGMLDSNDESDMKKRKRLMRDFLKAQLRKRIIAIQAQIDNIK